jgi:hypothetical protein
VNRRASALAVLLGTSALLAGCGSAAAPAGHAPAAGAPRGGSDFLDTTAAVGDTTWAVVVMGGSVASENNFWQLFVRPAGTSTWKLATPPGVADNGGLVVAGQTPQAVITAFRPSQLLTFTPLTQTGDAGRSWSSSSAPIRGALADDPGALAAGPAAGQLLAVLTSGTAEVAVSGGTGWSTLATSAQIAASAAGRRCGLGQLTAGTFTPAGAPLLAGTCDRPGTAGLFARANGTWQAAGPQLPAATAREQISIRSLTRTTTGDLALLTAGTGKARTFYAAQSGRTGTWTVSPPLSLDGAGIASVSSGPGGTLAVITASGSAAVMTAPDQGWQTLPKLPARTVTLAPGGGTGVEALTVNRATLTVWRLAPGRAGWQQAQQIKVPIQYGTSS